MLGKYRDGLCAPLLLLHSLILADLSINVLIAIVLVGIVCIESRVAQGITHVGDIGLVTLVGFHPDFFNTLLQALHLAMMLCLKVHFGVADGIMHPILASSMRRHLVLAWYWRCFELSDHIILI